MGKPQLGTFEELYFSIAYQQGLFLKAQMVCQPSVQLSKRVTSVDIDAYSSYSVPKIEIKVVRGDDEIHQVITKKSNVSVGTGQFFKLDEFGKLYTLDGFTGLQQSNKSVSVKKEQTENAPNYLPENRLKSFVKKIPLVFQGLKLIKNAFEKPIYNELSHYPGICFRIIQEREGVFVLECYDNGGIFDEHINAEGINYPAQVPGNYYADAYSILLFLKIYEHTDEQCWLDAARNAWGFLNRIYPQYKPSHIAWHHSDFKNAAILEIAHQFGEKFSEFSSFPHSLVEDFYEPTNVFALRCHWKSLNNYLKLSADSTYEADLDRVISDQTADGLYHDNIAAYPDAHDLTYHQYSTACLAQALMYSDNAALEKSFMKAVRFSLSVFGPRGEPAYVGRASNNLHQSASAAIAFHKAAELTKDSHEREQFLKAAYLAVKRIKEFQTSSGMVPTGLNSNVVERMGWNHCETPYNALCGYFLLRALDICKDVSPPTCELPLEKNNRYIANDAGYAAASDSNLYVVIFSGCDKSYAWSEGKHITGGAGIALFGKEGVRSLLPCLNLHHTSQIFTSDFPVINNELPFGRGQLKRNSDNSIVMNHSYGGAEIERVYRLIEEQLVIETKITGVELSSKDILFSWPLLLDDISSFNKKSRVIEYTNGQTVEITTSFPSKSKITKRISNAKGYVRLMTFSLQNDSSHRDFVYTVSIKFI